MNNKIFWIWAQFDKRSSAMISKMQKIISNHLKGPMFDPHLTLSGPIYSNHSDLIHHKIQKDIKNLSSFSVRTAGIYFKNQKFQSFSIKVIENDYLINTKLNFDKLFCLKNKEYFPHISLHYGINSEQQKYNLKKLLNFNDTSIDIDKISLIEVDEVKYQWKVVESYLLRQEKTF